MLKAGQVVAKLRLHHRPEGGDPVSLRALHSTFQPAVPGSVTSLFTRILAPWRIQFRLRYFFEHQSTDDFLQGPGDEVYLSALGTDSAAVHFGVDGKPTVDLIHSGKPIGDVSEDAVRDPWKTNPYVLMEFDLLRPGDWPRSYTTTLLIVEEDNEDLEKSFEEANGQVGDIVRDAVVKAADAGARAAAGAAAGALAGSVIPGIGNAVGAAVGAIAAAVYDEVIDKIKKGLANEVFTPHSLVVTVNDPAEMPSHPVIGRECRERIEQYGAVYELLYDWHPVD